ncbi:MAG TPA: hypothetical protein H9890_04135, partial [Candidatus Faecalibacterium intestinigallinarum]|nr:hypothetical protein [Candidatus Faecalibacterium intestinigallinarum]
KSIWRTCLRALWAYCTMFFSLVKRSDKNPFTFYGGLPKNCETGAIIRAHGPYYPKGYFWKEEPHGTKQAENVAGLF